MHIQRLIIIRMQDDGTDRQTDRKQKVESDTNPSAFLPSNRAAAAAIFFRFSSSFTFLSWD